MVLTENYQHHFYLYAYKTAAKNASKITAPKIAPIVGPTIGIQEYFQLDPPLPFIGSIAWAILGPKSLAGLRAYPVAPPVDIPRTTIRSPTNKPPLPGWIPTYP